MSGGEWSHLLDPLRALGFAFWSAAVVAVLQLAIILGSHDGISWWRVPTLVVLVALAVAQFVRARRAGSSTTG